MTGPLSPLGRFNAEVIECRTCPRLVSWRELVAEERRAAYRDETYWGRPVPGFGDSAARIAIVGLAPAAHGGNRTGRVFTGDRSGDWLYAALHRAGLANQPTSTHIDDGLELHDAWVTAVVKCAPPANRPTIVERDTCTERWLIDELALLSNLKVIVCLGRFAYEVIGRLAGVSPSRRPAFAHGAEVSLPDGKHVVCSFHPSQQNTFTKRLTEPMLDAVFAAALDRRAG